MDTVYIERQIADHPTTRRLLERFGTARIIRIERYGDVFNAPSQNFAAQKSRPALILAAKHGRRVLPTPPGYHIGGQYNYYFSHMLNCVFDCRYCFLQGMYRSGNYVVFVNIDDMLDDIETIVRQHDEPVWFFSGYDCDSLALDAMTGFVDVCLERFGRLPTAHLELRTKSTQIRPLLSRRPLPNVVVAYSLSPAELVTAEEHGTPALDKRLSALQQLQQAGWHIGLRFDPLLKTDNFESLYGSLFDETFDRLDMTRVHSVSLGHFRLPKRFHRRMTDLYPREPVLAHALVPRGSMVSYGAAEERRMTDYCESRLFARIRADQYFPASLP